MHVWMSRRRMEGRRTDGCQVDRSMGRGRPIATVDGRLVVVVWFRARSFATVVHCAVAFRTNRNATAPSAAPSASLASPAVLGPGRPQPLLSGGHRKRFRHCSTRLGSPRTSDNDCRDTRRARARTPLDSCRMRSARYGKLYATLRKRAHGFAPATCRAWRRRARGCHRRSSRSDRAYTCPRKAFAVASCHSFGARWSRTP